ncbi:MAG: hypothetical protein MUO85_09590 [candidate division Zixibacteria bacterium]|nr:hypothetical protein [candidate division Zixibacteria bacterium]
MYLSSAELKQLELLREKTITERFNLMTQLIDAQMEAMRAGIRYKKPKMSDKELRKCLKSRMMQIYSIKQGKL